MGQFLYFKPGGTRADAMVKSLRNSPLAGPFGDMLRSPKTADEGLAVNEIPRGPQDVAGVMVNVGATRMDDAQQPSYDPNHQQWCQLPKSDWWIGLDDRFRPGEVDLRRPTQIVGYPYVLRDGGEWQCPTLRAVNETTGNAQICLPTTRRLTPSGIERWIDPEYQSLWLETMRFVPVLMGEATCTPDEKFGFACRCLALNYRVSEYEVVFLDLINDVDGDNIWKAALDWPLLQEMIRKLESSSPKDIAPVPA